MSRRDRKAGENRGGILTLQRQDFTCLVHIKNSEEEERSLHFLRIEVDTFLVINWYSPGASEYDGFEKFHEELKAYSGQISGPIIAGDSNVHHRKWLRFSNAKDPIPSRSCIE